MSTVLALIPARGGSKSVPRKNIASVGGKPLIAWTVEAARQSGCLDRIVVTTEDTQIAQVAQRWGAEAPFVRPMELAQDDTPGMAPLLHAVRWLDEQEGYRPELVICLQPTSPLRTAQDIAAAVELLHCKNADSVVSVVAAERPPHWMKRIDAQGRLQDFLRQQRPTLRRQDLPCVYALNGAIYLAHRTRLCERHTFLTNETYAYVMPPERSLDIDTPWDLYLADLVLTHS